MRILDKLRGLFARKKVVTTMPIRSAPRFSGSPRTPTREARFDDSDYDRAGAFNGIAAASAMSAPTPDHTPSYSPPDYSSYGGYGGGSSDGGGASGSYGSCDSGSSGGDSGGGGGGGCD